VQGRPLINLPAFTGNHSHPKCHFECEAVKSKQQPPLFAPRRSDTNTPIHYTSHTTTTSHLPNLLPAFNFPSTRCSLRVRSTLSSRLRLLHASSLESPRLLLHASSGPSSPSVLLSRSMLSQANRLESRPARTSTRARSAFPASSLRPSRSSTWMARLPL
jgi:hypothetical protein